MLLKRFQVVWRLGVPVNGDVTETMLKGVQKRVDF